MPLVIINNVKSPFGEVTIKYVCVCVYVSVNLQIYLETSSPHQANKIPKLLGINYVAKNWALVMMLKALPSLHKRFVVKITYH